MFLAIGRQEASIWLWTLDGVIQNKEENNLPLEVVDATSGSPVLTDAIAIAILAGAKHPDAARAFVDFAGSEGNQVELANEFSRMPTLKSALRMGPAWMHEFDYKFMDVDWARLSAKKSE